MKTREKIIEFARKAFNERGMAATSPRDIAKGIGISYGNLTYHFATKELLIASLYEAMLLENRKAAEQLPKQENLLNSILAVPELLFDISCQYRFLFTDYTLIMRQYPDIRKHHLIYTTQRKGELLQVLQVLQNQELLSPELTNKHLDYIMELSVATRSFWFVKNAFQKNIEDLKNDYVQYVNAILWPYLSEAGKLIYEKVTK